MIERPERPDTLPETALLTQAPSQTNALRPSVERHVGDTCRELGDKHLGRGRGGTMSSNQEEKQWAEMRAGPARGLRPAWGAVQRAGVDLGSSPSLQLCPAAGLLGTPVPALGPSLPRTCVAQGRHVSRSALHRQLPLPRSPHQPAPAGALPSRWRRPREFAGPSHSPGGAAFTQSTQSKPADATPPPPPHHTPAWSILVGVRKPAV